MYIISELFDFIEKCITDLDNAKNTHLYKIINNIINNTSPNVEIGIPYFILFEENLDYIDIIRHDFVKHNPVYDDESKCFVFKGINRMFYGTKEILKKIHIEYPNDTVILDNLNKIEIFLKIANDSICMDDLCEILNNNLNF